MVRRAAYGALRGPALGPGALVEQRAIQLLPHPGALLGVDQRIDRARMYRYLRAPGDLQQPQRMAYLLVAPTIAARNRDTEHLDIAGLQQHQDRLQIGSRRSEGVLVDDDLAPRASMLRAALRAALRSALLRVAGTNEQRQHQHRERQRRQHRVRQSSYHWSSCRVPRI